MSGRSRPGGVTTMVTTRAPSPAPRTNTVVATIRGGDNTGYLNLRAYRCRVSTADPM